MEYTSFLFLLEMIGTVAFASSGALVGIRKNMDIFGVLVLGITTAVGGGCIRDLILGIHPPRMFHSFSYVGAAIVTSCFLFAVIYWKKQLLDSRFLTAYEQAMNTFDAIGLGIFTVAGIRTAMSVSTDFGTFLLNFVGLVTGIGGGMLRYHERHHTVCPRQAYIRLCLPGRSLPLYPALPHARRTDCHLAQRLRCHPHSSARGPLPLESAAHPG